MEGRVLIIATTDSGGGAGIQADIKTVTALGGYAATAVAALTAQNTRDVYGVVTLDPAFVALQMEVVLDDIGADALKTGVLFTAAATEAVARVIEERARHLPLVIDPVMVAKSGASLIEADAREALKARLLPLAAVVTPNIPEAEALTGLTIGTVDDMRRAADAILAMGAAAALVKGGHGEGDRVTDLLRTAQGEERIYDDPRIETRSTHGTGCTLASAIATGLAQGMLLEDAVTRARTYLREAIRTAPGFGSGHGPLNHAHTVRPF